MCNAVSEVEWQPLGFVNFSGQEAISLAVRKDDDAPEEIMSVTLEMENESSLDTQRAELVTQEQEKGYHEGLILGKEEGFQAGYDAGQKQGYEEGRAYIEQELAEQVQQQKMIALEAITQLVANFQYAIQQLDESVVPKLTSLALMAAENIVGKITNSDQKQLTLIVQELINQYPPLGKDVQLYVNPNDVMSIETMLVEELEKYGWRVMIDPDMESGGCRVISERVEMDATVSSRWQNLVSALQKDSG